MNFKPFDRLPVVEWASWWDLTLERWKSEGLPAHLTERNAVNAYFGLDHYKQLWFTPIGPGCPHPASYGAGIIRDESDYDRIRTQLFPDDSIDLNYLGHWAEDQKNGDAVLWFTLDGFFWFPRVLFGIENHFYAFYDQPNLMRRINSDLTEWMMRDNRGNVTRWCSRVWSYGKYRPKVWGARKEGST